MFPLLVGTILIDAALLGLLIYIVARHNATHDLFNRVAVVAGITIAGTLMDWIWGDMLGGWVLALQALLAIVLLVWLVGTNPVQGAVIVVLFIGIKIALRLALAWVLRAQ